MLLVMTLSLVIFSELIIEIVPAQQKLGPSGVK